MTRRSQLPEIYHYFLPVLYFLYPRTDYVLKPRAYYIHHHKKTYILPTKRVYPFPIRKSDNFSEHNLSFVTESECVYCTMRASFKIFHI